MKTFILIAVIAALAVYNNAASIADESPIFNEEIIQVHENGRDFSKNYFHNGAGRQIDWDNLILFFEATLIAPASGNTVQHREVFFHGNSTTEINRISISNLPSVPGHTHVGFFWTHGFVKQRSPPGGALRATVRFFGRYLDHL